MAVTKTTYSQLAAQAAESVLLEIVQVLGEYRDNIVLIGGLVPKYLITGVGELHIGSTDVDIALDHRRFDEPGYRTIHELLIKHDYRRDTEQPFIYRRTIVLDEDEIIVQVDLLSGEYGGTGKNRRTQKIQDIRPRKARGADIAFDDPVHIKITGKLPGGGKDSATIQIAGIVPFIVMKAMAMRDRSKQKDPYDIYYCLQHFQGGMAEIVEAINLLKGNKLVAEAMEILTEKFKSPEHVGSAHIVEFLEITDPDEADRVKRDAYERVLYLIENYAG